MRSISVFVFILIFSCCFSQEYRGYITSVIDGDTFVFQTNEGALKIRSEGIDAPEHPQEFGEEATDFMKRYLYLDAIVVPNGVDRSGRTIGTLFVDINNKMLLSGLAWFYKDYSKNETYKQSQEYAKGNNLGLWNSPNPTPPWQWRKPATASSTLNLDFSEVLICTSKNSYAYHSRYCQGLKGCKSEISKVSLSTAQKMGRKPCGYCY